MGKKKIKQDKNTTADVEKRSRKDETGKAQKNYSLSADGGDKEDSRLPKVQIPQALERTVVDLIQERRSRKIGSVSGRISSKKLNDMYMSLSAVGFSHQHIEQAMSNTVPSGGDLIDAFDWLCLNIPNEKLPAGFSQALCEEETKCRPKFTEIESSQEVTVNMEASSSASVVSHKTPEVSTSSMKDWILQYAADDTDSDNSEEQEGSETDDPNEKYLTATAKLLDAKIQASLCKQSGDKTGQKEASVRIRQLTQEMAQLEKHPKFNPDVKITDVESSQASETGSDVTSAGTGNGVTSSTSDKADLGEEDLGFAMFDEETAQAQASEKEVKESGGAATPMDIRKFEYTRQQWTGKSPKQFLIDWVRKNLKSSRPPSYTKAHVKGNLYRCRVKVERKKEGDISACPDIWCENIKEAEHLASTLALYELCKGQRVHQLLPPPYREVWLEWLDAEEKQKKNTLKDENKPRDQFISKLLKKLKVSSAKSENITEDDEEGDDEEDSWERLADEEIDTHVSDKISTREKSSSVQKALRRILLDNQSKDMYKELKLVREQLPVYQHRDAILDTICRSNVVVVAGETGSGKSTQIPQFVLEKIISAGNTCNIICTQPRRISAISLANRVSAELGENGPGSSNSLCGYQIRFESKKVATTSLLYCTTGVLLRKLQNDPLLEGVTHVIVDEVHERSVQSDFLLIILKTILSRRPDFRVILMSATLDSDKFSAYFHHCPVFQVPGRTYPVEVLQVEDLVEKTGFVLDDDSPYAVRYDKLVKEEKSQVTVTDKGGLSHTQDLFWQKQDPKTIDLTGLEPEIYSLKTRNTVTRMHPERINMDLILELLYYMDSAEEYCLIDGAVLIFLPGLSHIQELYEMLSSDRRFSDNKRYRIIALHSILSSQDQSSAFTVPPSGVRKIVIATNIAETGITIPDVSFVIDTGKVKETRYIESTQLSTLEEVYVSRASADQRKGRAGRVREGVCFRLFTKQRYSSLKAYSIPEILRVPLEELCLHIMKSELGDPSAFLSQALDPPNQTAVQRAMSILREIGACDESEPTLTPLGHHLALLPVNVRVGKMLLLSAVFGCLEPMAIIAAVMTNKSPFTVPMGMREEVDMKKQSLSVANSDHLTLYKAYAGWQAAKRKGKGAEMSYCKSWFLKRTTLLDIENVKDELIKLVQSVGFVSTRKDSVVTGDLKKEQIAILKAVLAAGLYPNVAQVTWVPPVDAAANPTQQVCVATTPQGLVQAHPSSVNRFLAANGWLVYHEKVKQSQVFLRDSTLVSAFPLLLFGGQISVQHLEQTVTIDNWIQLKAYAKTGVLFKEMRILVDDLLQRKLDNPNLKILDDGVVHCIMKLLQTER